MQADEELSFESVLFGNHKEVSSTNCSGDVTPNNARDCSPCLTKETGTQQADLVAAKATPASQQLANSVAMPCGSASTSTGTSTGCLSVSFTPSSSVPMPSANVVSTPQSPHITFSLHSPVFSPRSPTFLPTTMASNTATSNSPSFSPSSLGAVPSINGTLPPLLALGGNGASNAGGNNGGVKGEPNCTVVLKNLPFYMKQDALYQTLARAGVQPHHIGMHYDTNGMFRGMAFVKYHSIAEATKAVEVIPTIDFGGRRIKSEFKNKKSKSNPTVQDESMRKIWEELVALRDSDKHMTLRRDLTREQLKQIRQMADRLQLQLVVPITGGISQIMVVKKAPVESSNGVNGTTATPQARSTNASTPAPVSVTKSLHSSKTVCGSAPERSNLTERTLHGPHNSTRHAVFTSVKPSSAHAIVRQPKGPDETKGFDAEYKETRKAVAVLPKTAYQFPEPESAPSPIPKPASDGVGVL